MQQINIYTEKQGNKLIGKWFIVDGTRVGVSAGFVWGDGFTVGKGSELIGVRITWDDGTSSVIDQSTFDAMEKEGYYVGA